MFRIKVSIENPATMPSVFAETTTFQFDPATMTQTKWAAAWPAIAALITEMTVKSAGKEPPIW